jgi:histidyl-tRNA synthetase
VGSICGGGRYDDLVSRFAGEARHIPCIGMSVGIERVFTILSSRSHASAVRPNATQVYVMGMGNVSLETRLGIVRELWAAGIPTEFQYRVKNVHLSKQSKLAERTKVPIGVRVGEDEVKENCVQVKLLNAKEMLDGEVKVEWHTIPREQMVEFIYGLMKEHTNQ